VDRVYRRLREALAADERITSHRTDAPGRIQWLRGDFRSVQDLGGIDCIVTDPPYGKQYLPLLRGWAL
jgi:hypothetical protein